VCTLAAPRSAGTCCCCCCCTCCHCPSEWCTGDQQCNHCYSAAMQDCLNRWPAPRSCHAYSYHQCWSSHLPSLLFAQQLSDPAAVIAFATSHHRLDACRQISPALWSSMHTHPLLKPQECPMCCKTCCSVSCGLNFEP